MPAVMPPAPGTKPALWRDLNVFVAAFGVMASVGGMLVFVPLSLLVKAVLPSRQAEMLAFSLGYVLIALVLAGWWWKHGLSPRLRDPARERRFQWGHGLLAVFNITLVTMFVLPLVGGLSWLPRVPGVGAMVLVMASLAPMGMLAGLAMVWSSRGSPAVFAETLPGAQPGSRSRSSAGWSALAPKPPRLFLIVVLIGLMASSMVLYIATVFGSLGFQGNSARFTNVVLPIVGGCYVLYLTAVIFLFLKRRTASVWVAWAPFLIVVVLGPSLQVLRGLFVR